MKASLAQTWKRKQQRLNRKNSKKVTKKFKRKRDFRGKYFVLLSESKCAALLKFTSHKLCEALCAARVTSKSVKLISKKYILTARRNKKFLRQVEVIVSEKFKHELKSKLRDGMQQPEQNKIIKIFTCPICNHKFTNREQFRRHHHPEPGLNSTGSEGELLIDDDVMLIPDDPRGFKSPDRKHIKHNLKPDPDEPKAEKFYCLMDNCGKSFDKEDNLILHIGMLHNKQHEGFECPKCGDRFSKESVLQTHQRLSHPVEIIAPLPLPSKLGRKTTQCKVSPDTIEKVVNNKLEAVQIEKIVFRRYDSYKSTFVCRFCSVTFEQRPHLDRHMTVMHIVKVFNCYKCGVPYAKKMLLLNHLRSAHLSQVNDPGYIASISDLDSVAQHRCAFCFYSSENRSQVDTHMLSEHYDQFEKNEDHDEEQHSSSPDSLENLLLPESAQLLGNQDDELLHEIPERSSMAHATKRRRPANDPSFKFRCVRCGRRFARQKSLRHHECTRTAVLVNGSTSCNSSSSSPTKRTNSQMVNGFYNCLLCPQVFTDKEIFSRHVSKSHSSSSQPPRSNGFYGSLK